jgi:hemoglobin
VSERAPARIFDEIGGAERLRALVDRFYDLMDEREEFGTLRALHPADLAGSREKLYLFLSGWTGGPPLYIQKHGHPRLRARHLPFSIGERERDEWIACMRLAMRDQELDARLEARLAQAFFQVADFMRNRAG